MSTGQPLPLITVRQLLRRYPSGFQLSVADFSLYEGTTLAFLGANGAGKSTLFQMLTGNLDPTAGEILWQGHKLSPDSHHLKRQIGYLPQQLNLPPWITGKEVLTYAASLYQLPQALQTIEAAMAYWDCAAFAHQPLSSCSYGMQKRITLALATLPNPRLLILDEPFSGLDLYHTRALENAIISRRRQGLTTILSTHVAPYVAQLCEQVFIIKQGQVKKLEGWLEKDYANKISAIEAQFF